MAPALYHSNARKQVAAALTSAMTGNGRQNNITTAMTGNRRQHHHKDIFHCQAAGDKDLLALEKHFI
jgi:hypothetical protein